jgi:predicted ATP-grasp superfamily ATP-dependent carboligase
VRPSIAIVGASARAAAASAVRAGLQPITADLFADADLRAIATATRISPYPEGLVDWFRAVEPSAWMYTGALENYPELVDQLAWLAPLWGNPGDVLTHVRSPWELAKALGDAGLLFPEMRESAEDLPRDGSWLAKTYQGASGSGVTEYVERGRQGDKETRRATISNSESPGLPVSLSPCLVYQRRIAGTACSAVFVGEAGTASVLGITRQLVGETWLGAHGFQYAGSIAPHTVSEAAQETIARIGETLTKQFELRGLFGVDFILDLDRVWTLEVNPRYTASVEIVERATGAPVLAMHAAACAEGLEARDWAIGSRISPRPRAPGTLCCGKAILFAKREIVISEAFAQMTLAEALLRPWPTLADVSTAGTPIEAGRPILTIFASGATADDVEGRLRIRADELERQLYGSEVP